MFSISYNKIVQLFCHMDDFYYMDKKKGFVQQLFNLSGHSVELWFIYCIQICFPNIDFQYPTIGSYMGKDYTSTIPCFIELSGFFATS